MSRSRCELIFVGWLAGWLVLMVGVWNLHYLGLGMDVWFCYCWAITISAMGVLMSMFFREGLVYRYIYTYFHLASRCFDIHISFSLIPPPPVPPICTVFPLFFSANVLRSVVGLSEILLPLHLPHHLTIPVINFRTLMAIPSHYIPPNLGTNIPPSLHQNKS